MDGDLLKDYQEFVDEVSSDATKNIDDFGDAVDIVEECGVEPTRLLTASIGLALGTDIEELIDINTAKLEARYPGGFDEFRSDNRDEDDI